MIDQVNRTTEFTIFSSQHFASLLNFLEHNEVSYKPLVGSWEGNEEQSVLIPSVEFDRLSKELEYYLAGEIAILRLGAIDNVRKLRPATIIYLQNGFKDYLGYFVPVPKEEAIKRKGWTCAAGQYFVCELGGRTSFPIHA